MGDQKITSRVMRLEEFDDAIYYRVACQCGNQDCDLMLELDYDKEFGSINLHMYKKLAASADWGNYWEHFDFIRVGWNKIKMCWTIITKGYIEISEDTMISDEEHIDNFIVALQQGKKFIIGKEKEWEEFLKSRNLEKKDLPSVKKVKS